MKKLHAIDLFSGCGGLTTGLEEAGINVRYAVELDSKISMVYHVNHPQTVMVNSDIKDISDSEFKKWEKILILLQDVLHVRDLQELIVRIKYNNILMNEIY